MNSKQIVPLLIALIGLPAAFFKDKIVAVFITNINGTQTVTIIPPVPTTSSIANKTEVIVKYFDCDINHSIFLPLHL